MQLEPEEDNRDGYAIRQMTKQVLQRREAQKFLLVFLTENRLRSVMNKTELWIRVKLSLKQEKEG